MLATGDREKDGGLWAAKIILVFKIIIRERSRSRKYVYIQYTEVKGPMCIAHNIAGSDFLRLSTNYEVSQNFGKSSAAWKWES